MNTRSRTGPHASTRSLEGPQSREEHKQLTRQALVRSALRLLAGNSFDSISLREVTREAGISPTAFYRHFRDMEELGLVLVEESFATLRGMLRDARSNPEIVRDTLRQSVEVLSAHVRDHEAHMRFIGRERHGGVKQVRRAIAREISMVANELALDLSRFPVVSHWPADDQRLLADLIVEQMVGVAAELVDAEGRTRDDLVRQAERKLRLIVVGVGGWRPSGRK